MLGIGYWVLGRVGYRWVGIRRVLETAFRKRCWVNRIGYRICGLRMTLSVLGGELLSKDWRDDV
jgi:hypothetical protein